MTDITLMKDQCSTQVEIWDLPDEVISLIFSNLTEKNILTEVVDVCVRWREIINVDTLFWKRLKVVIDCDNFLNLSVLNSSDLTSLLRLKRPDEIYIGEHDLCRLSNLQSVQLENGFQTILNPLQFEPDETFYSHQARLVINVIDIVSKSCKNLEHFDFSRCIGAAHKETLKFLNEKYEKISAIKFDVSCIWRVPYVELTSFSYLNTIISHDYKFNRLDFYCLIENCAQLSSLWILLARHIKNYDVIHLLDKKKDSLKELGMALTVSDEVLSKLKECSELTVLFFSDARYISLCGINSLTDLPRLKYISLHRATLQPTDLIPWTLSSSVIPQLIVLDLTGYYFKDSKLLHQIPKNCLVTFDNNIEEALRQPYKLNKSHIHWMYYKLLKSTK